MVPRVLRRDPEGPPRVFSPAQPWNILVGLPVQPARAQGWVQTPKAPRNPEGQRMRRDPWAQGLAKGPKRSPGGEGGGPAPSGLEAQPGSGRRRDPARRDERQMAEGRHRLQPPLGKLIKPSISAGLPCLLQGRPGPQLPCPSQELITHPLMDSAERQPEPPTGPPSHLPGLQAELGRGASLGPLSTASQVAWQASCRRAGRVDPLAPGDLCVLELAPERKEAEHRPVRAGRHLLCLTLWVRGPR